MPATTTAPTASAVVEKNVTDTTVPATGAGGGAAPAPAPGGAAEKIQDQEKLPAAEKVQDQEKPPTARPAAAGGGGEPAKKQKPLRQQAEQSAKTRARLAPLSDADDSHAS